MKVSFIVICSLLFTTTPAFTQTGGISGTVTEEATGQPVSGIIVFVDDFDTGSHVHSVQTDASGMYSLALSPGGYRVGVAASHTLNVSVAASHTVYVGEWFDDAVNPANATEVTVQASGTVPDINFALAYSSAFGGAFDAGNGLKYISWLGWYNDLFWPWVWDYQHNDWIWMVDNGPENIWMWDNGLQRWIWTRTDIYPWIVFAGDSEFTWRFSQ